MSFDFCIVFLFLFYECCSYCVMFCICDSLNGCKGFKKLFESKFVVELGILFDYGFRIVLDEDKVVLKDVLLEV